MRTITTLLILLLCSPLLAEGWVTAPAGQFPPTCGNDVDGQPTCGCNKPGGPVVTCTCRLDEVRKLRALVAELEAERDEFAEMAAKANQPEGFKPVEREPYVQQSSRSWRPKSREAMLRCIQRLAPDLPFEIDETWSDEEVAALHSDAHAGVFNGLSSERSGGHWEVRQRCATCPAVRVWVRD